MLEAVQLLTRDAIPKALVMHFGWSLPPHKFTPARLGMIADQGRLRGRVGFHPGPAGTTQSLGDECLRTRMYLQRMGHRF
jgi:hypothetical protein